MDFLNHRKGSMVFYQLSAFLLYRNRKRWCEFEETEISSKAVAVTCALQGGKPLDFYLDFVREFGLWMTIEERKSKGRKGQEIETSKKLKEKERSEKWYKDKKKGTAWYRREAMRESGRNVEKYYKRRSRNWDSRKKGEIKGLKKVRGFR
jgi:hypothetical protein